MAVTVGSVCVAVTLLMCVLGGQAVDLLRAKATSGSFYICVNVFVSERNRPTVTTQCQFIQPGSAASSSSSEQLLHCTLPNLKLLTDYILNVTAVTASGESSSDLSSFMLEDIVKPDPPVDVRVSPLNIRNLLVEWSPPPTWTNLYIFPLKYQILYQWESRGTTRSINLGPFENTKVELKGLTPGRPYLFQVCAMELLGLGKCSDWSLPVKVTIPRVKL
ncbi:Interleukin-27 subunit beta [Collichthys lucidus]|uniref:Interleukin-27 subunit beta n=1 Tax=Collichthys lucidus TaxID=240159 RepID=A0A4U5VFF4_COLLU|nr:Interleukin-27 subunit beta [Collichthys lucidus]